MVLWHAWTGLLQQLLQMLAVDEGLGWGLAIIVLTVLVRVALMPLTWSVAYRTALRQAKLAQLQPRLAAIRERFADDPREQMTRTVALYREHGLGMIDGTSVLAAFVQIPVLWGLYQALREGMGTAAFLWVRNEVARKQRPRQRVAQRSGARAASEQKKQPAQGALAFRVKTMPYCINVQYHKSPAPQGPAGILSLAGQSRARGQHRLELVQRGQR